jgi:hypothetical protein
MPPTFLPRCSTSCALTCSTTSIGRPSVANPASLTEYTLWSERKLWLSGTPYARCAMSSPAWRIVSAYSIGSWKAGVRGPKKLCLRGH